MKPCLYEAVVVHRRFHPRPHHLRYRILYLGVPLGELDRLAGLSYNKPGWVQLRDRDFACVDPDGTLWPDVLKHLPLGLDAKSCFLVTLPRVWGYLFNPVVFFFFYGPGDDPLGVLVEVSNTYHERKLFWLNAQDYQAGRSIFVARRAKEFYISPFLRPDAELELVVQDPRQGLNIQVHTFEGGKKILTAILTGRTRVWTRWQLWKYLLFVYPLQSILVMVRIHWHALQLWWKGVRFYRKSEMPEAQRDVLRPHV